MTFPMKTVTPTPQHLRFRRAVEEAIRVHGATFDASEILAMMAHLCGQLIALQDQRKMTPAMAIQLVQDNLEQGNREVVENLLNAQTGGHA